MRMADILRASTASAVTDARSVSFQDMFGSGSDITGFGRKKAGELVNTQSAASLSAVYASWRIVSEAIATLPRNALASPRGLPTYLDRPVWFDSPNVDDTWIEFLGQVMVSLLQSGDAFVLLDWKNAKLEGMTVLDPASCVHVRSGVITISNKEHGTSADFPDFQTFRGQARASREILHIRGMSNPGSLSGMSPIRICAETLGVSLASQSYGADFFANDATPAGIIEVPENVRLSSVGQAALRKAWNDMYGSKGMKKSVAVLVEGARFKSLQVSPNEAQFLETRKFGVQEIARIYGVPPHLIGDTTNTTGWGTGMAEQNTAFVVHTLRPYLERLEARFSGVLQVDVNVSSAHMDINEDALLRGATTDRWEVLRKNVAAGIMTADEARESEGFRPLSGGKGSVPWIPLQQAPQGFTSTGSPGKDLKDD